VTWRVWSVFGADDASQAGHIVAAWWLGLPVRGVTIAPTNLTKGSAFVGRNIEDTLFEAAEAMGIGSPIPSRARRAMEAEAMMTMAGPLAEQRAIELDLVSAPEPPPTEPLARELHERRTTIERLERELAAAEAGEKDCPADIERVRSITLSCSATPEEGFAYATWLDQRTRSLIALPPFWRATRALAEELLVKETLSGAACRRIIDHALMPPPSQRRLEGTGYCRYVDEAVADPLNGARS
jgi:hypothetical protein